ncbi:glutathione S-transferase N-terminal domain-containing protein [Pseudomarimonas arenosa]|uniref:Glutathione S-transferase N-terminal domain-containing protein n=1 Tax=Pseudomarimonas arenosa TaxID=2774145 RepID=A0AAW3ZK04_9GAMM|nr:glutathione S-transferase N-terminal domain-containing protein [Pseudomarimonas arenosa]MBD8526088.1 glutathione S-transferase N-terminal domain-containing protein [Pseudomarimonas arenosa]
MPQPPMPDLIRSLLASTARGWRGTQVLRAVKAPAKQLVVFDRENDPECRLLREVLTELQLDALIQPCPEGGRRFAQKLPRGARLPYLIDRNEDARLQGVRDCLGHLLQHYAGIGWARHLLTSWPMRLSSQLASRLRGRQGALARPSRSPRKPLELYSFESSPYSRLVRERLCELELPWVLRSFGKEQLSDWGPPNLRFSLRPWAAKPGGRREAMLSDTGKAQVPYLIDPNQGVELFESTEILRHLDQYYAR